MRAPIPLSGLHLPICLVPAVTAAATLHPRVAAARTRAAVTPRVEDSETKEEVGRSSEYLQVNRPHSPNQQEEEPAKAPALCV